MDASCSESDSILSFDITNAHIHEKDITENRHVLYTLRIRHVLAKKSFAAAIVDRRYTQFLQLYNALRQDFPDLMANVPFPRKVLLGNFDNQLICTRTTGFEALLKHISCHSQLRASPALLNFLQEPELGQAKLLLANNQFRLAQPILENSFRVLSSVFLDRSVPVLLALCRLFGCCASMPDCPETLQWADLALRRYDGVSDIDLLQLYVPLLNVCANVWLTHGRDKSGIEQTMSDLLRQGVRYDPNRNLLDIVIEIETKLSGVS